MGRNGTGVREASSSSYEITFTYKGVRCRERLKIKPSPANRKRVERHLAAIQVAIEDGTFDYAVTFPDSPRRLLFVETKAEATGSTSYFESWLETKKKHLKASTWQGYFKIINHLVIPAFKGTMLSDIKRPAIRSAAGSGPRTPKSKTPPASRRESPCASQSVRSHGRATSGLGWASVGASWVAWSVIALCRAG